MPGTLFCYTLLY